MKTIVGAAITSVGTVLVAACGDVYADVGGVEGIDSSSVTADASVALPPPVIPTEPPKAPCDATRPRENTSCVQGAICEYGASADAECNDVLVCRGSFSSAAWELRAPDTCHQRACPAGAHVAQLDGHPCSLEGDGGAVTDADEAVCNVGDGVCACTTGPDATSAHPRRWVCVRPVTGCPPQRPRIGAACTGALWCNYGSCKFKRGVLMECVDGTWSQGGATCR